MNDTYIQQGQNWLTSLLEHMDLAAPVSAEMKLGTDEQESLWLTIDPQDLSFTQQEQIIGNQGRVIDAMQYLASITLNHGLNREEQHPLTVDMGDYRAKRLAELQAIAIAVAERVQESGASEAIDDLSSAERRQMHTFFKEYPNLKTESKGQEPHRQLIVQLAE